MRPLARLGLPWLVAFAIAGCGSPELWARYRAERQFWHARRAVERIQVNPQLATAEDFDRAAARFRAIVERFPLAEWASPERLRDPRAAAVASVSGDAWISLGRLEESMGRTAEALAIYRRAGAELAGLPRMRLKTLVAEAAALDRVGDSSSATPVVARIAREFPPVDPESGESFRAVLDAPLRLAADLRARGRAASADSVLDLAAERFAGEAAGRAGEPAAPDLWIQVARVRHPRVRAGRLDLALDALRRALVEPAGKSSRGVVVMAMAEYCLEGGWSDSALVYAAWAAKFGPEPRARAMMLEGRIWETVQVDSAIAAYERFLEAFPRAGESQMVARFRRAELLEQTGRWEQARGDYRALAAASATQDLALRASERIVLHHVGLGETDLARLEARRALETFGRLLTIVRDEETLLRIRQVRARLLLAVENWPEACAALQDLWKRYGDKDAGVSAGFQAAELAEHRLGDRERARGLYQELASRGPTSTDQERARRELERLRRERG